MNADLFAYQTRLQGLANKLGDDIAKAIGSTDRELVNLLLREISRLPKDKAKAHKKLEWLESEIAQLRAVGFGDALKISENTVENLIEVACGNAAKELKAQTERRERGIRAIEIPDMLPRAKVDEILKYAPFDGNSIEKWFKRFERNDFDRITQVIQRGFVDGHTLETIIRSIRGTRQYDWRDGILETSRQGARMLGRTLINGASNAARLEMFKENRDVIDGVKFLGTFDSRTCLVCATYDGKIWPSDQLGKVVRPPMHPNCRCVLIPHVDLGEEFAGTRPVENEDFEKMARDAHEANPKATKPWEELTYDYRKQLRYREMEKWKKAGKMPYRHVSGDKTFKEIFDAQPESFQKSWLGTTRYEYFKAGKLTLDQMVSPDTGYVKTLEDLEKDGIITKRRRKK